MIAAWLAIDETSPDCADHAAAEVADRNAALTASPGMQLITHRQTAARLLAHFRYSSSFAV
jgi:hypothetical protein